MLTYDTPAYLGMDGRTDRGKSGLREKDFLEINQSETRIACGGHVC
jgi:hypothetical protein